MAVCAFAGMLIGCAGAEDMLEDVKGRKNLDKKDIDAREMIMESRSVRVFVVAAFGCLRWMERALRGLVRGFMCNGAHGAPRAS